MKGFKTAEAASGISGAGNHGAERSGAQVTETRTEAVGGRGAALLAANGGLTANGGAHLHRGAQAAETRTEAGGGKGAARAVGITLAKGGVLHLKTVAAAS